MVQRAIEQDAAVLAGLALLLWNDHDAAELLEEFAELLKSEGAACFLACEAGVPAGFAQCQLRHDYVEGAQTSPVGYLEGIFVLPEFRRQGIAGKLLQVFLDFAEGNHLAFLTLEVRASNYDAIALYGARGFRGVGRRKNYYEHPKEDAIIMTREFNTDGTEDTVPGAAADRL